MLLICYNGCSCSPNRTSRRTSQPTNQPTNRWPVRGTGTVGSRQQQSLQLCHCYVVNTLAIACGCGKIKGGNTLSSSVIFQCTNVVASSGLFFVFLVIVVVLVVASCSSSAWPPTRARVPACMVVVMGGRRRGSRMVTANARAGVGVLVSPLILLLLVAPVMVGSSAATASSSTSCSFTCTNQVLQHSNTDTNWQWSGARSNFSLRGPTSTATAQLPVYSSDYPTPIASGSPTATSAYVVLADNMTQSQELFCALLASDAFQSQSRRTDTHPLLLVVQFLGVDQSVDNGPSCAAPQNASTWLSWQSTSSWAVGDKNVALNTGDFSTSSYDVLDSLLTLLKDKYLFPNLGSVTLTGFGLGAEVRTQPRWLVGWLVSWLVGR